MRFAALFLLAALPSAAAITGVVRNATTGKPVPRAPVTLISFAQGMDPIEEVITDENGEFAFTKTPPGMALLRTEQQEVSYSKMLQPGNNAPVVFDVYQSLAEPAVPPTGRVIVLEPGANQMVINESYLYENKTDPPSTYRDGERGTLRFFLPPEAKGIVQVQAVGPAAMPMPTTAVETSEENVRMIDFPIKPGENRISLTYLIPYADSSATFAVKTIYPGMQTRVAAPSGVEVTGDGLVEFGTEPSTQAAIWELPRGQDVSLDIRGQGQIQHAEAAPAEDSGAPTGIEIEPAPIAKEMWWIFGIALAILLLGFVNLYGSNSATGKSADKRGSARAKA